MKTVIAIDSYKESLTSLQAGKAAAEGVLAACPDMETLIFPMADGGEGTVDALTHGFSGEKVETIVTGPLGEPVKASLGLVEKLGTAVIEIASACGMSLVNPERRNPLYTTSYGVGQLIKFGLDRGFRKFIIGLGGSATNDGGLGMLEALGYEFYDENDNIIGPYGRDLVHIKTVNTDGKDSRLSETEFIIASDVNNPLCGPKGASHIFGPQKGADEKAVKFLDDALFHFAEISAAAGNKDCAKEPGAGAAGGLGFAFLAYLGAHIRPGVDVVIEITNLEKAIREADYIITGEGKIDRQTSMGKAPCGVAKIAKKYDKPVIVVAGCVAQDAEVCNDFGIDGIFSIVQSPCTLEEAMDSEKAMNNLTRTVRQIFKLISAVTSKTR